MVVGGFVVVDVVVVDGFVVVVDDFVVVVVVIVVCEVVVDVGGVVPSAINALMAASKRLLAMGEFIVKHECFDIMMENNTNQMPEKRPRA